MFCFHPCSRKTQGSTAMACWLGGQGTSQGPSQAWYSWTFASALTHAVAGRCGTRAGILLASTVLSRIKKEWDDVSSVLQYLACNSLKGRGCPEASTVLGSSSELQSPEPQVFQVVVSSPSVWKSKKAETGTRVQVSTTARPSPTTHCSGNDSNAV